MRVLYDLLRKLVLYFEEGGAEVWVVDRARRAVSVYSQLPAGVTRIAGTPS